MPGFNQLAARRYLEVARRVLGEDLELSAVSPEISLSKILEVDPFEDAIHKKLRWWTTGEVNIAAAAGNRGTCQVLNPTGSSLIVVVLGGKIVQKPTAGLLIATIDGALIVPAQAPNIGYDTRLTNVAASIPVQSRNTIGNGVVGPNGIRVDEASSTAVNTDINLPSHARMPLAILAPGHQFNLWDGDVNEAAKFIVFGYERDARPEELQITS